MAETFFQFTNTLALAAWIALVLFPGKKLVSGALCAVAVPGFLALAYAAVIAWKLASNGLPSGDVMTLKGLREVSRKRIICDTFSGRVAAGDISPRHVAKIEFWQHFRTASVAGGRAAQRSAAYPSAV